MLCPLSANFKLAAPKISTEREGRVAAPIRGCDKIATGAYLQSVAGPPILIQHYQNRESDSTIVRW
jgi:hypothetical protein